MRYGKPYTYFLNKPGGTINTLYGSALLLSTSVVPVVGQIVVLGYQAEIAEDLVRDPELEDYSDFDFNRFVQYLTRGLWPFVVVFVIGLAVLGLMGVAAAAGVAVAVLTEQWVFGVLVGLVLLLPLTILGTMVQWPMLLHVQLSRELRPGEAVRFTASYIRKVGGQLFLSLVAHLLISSVLTVAGLLVLCIGVYPVTMILLMAQEHYMIQLYRLYLDEGGEPIGGAVEMLEIEED
jgi:hypothetical protein